MIYSTLALALSYAATFAVATEPHTSGGQEHIVIIDNDQSITPEVNEVLTRLELTEDHDDVHHVFKNSAFRGFAAAMNSHCLDLLANMTDVSIVEKTASVQSMYAIPNQRRDTVGIATRGHAPWGLNRISTAAFAAHDPREMDYSYNFVNGDLGSGSDVYIVDTGLYEGHVVFGGRAKQVWSFDKSNEITDGHGTHVAGTAAGETLGVASKANIFGVRTLAGAGAEGWSSNVVAGIDFVVQQHDARKANADFKGSVLSMSLASGGKVDAIDKALDAAIKAGVHVVVAAGNAGKDACAGSPASAGGTHGPAIVVGSVGISGDTSSFSNTGECVDVYAPGEDIISAWIGAPDVVNVLSGTSMATPHVTGIVAYAMANSTLANSPGLMKEWIRMQALPRGDGTVLANNGVWSSGKTGSKAMVSPNTIASAASPYKRSADFYGTSAPLATITFADDTTDSSSSSLEKRGITWKKIVDALAKTFTKPWINKLGSVKNKRSSIVSTTTDSSLQPRNPSWKSFLDSLAKTFTKPWINKLGSVKRSEASTTTDITAASSSPSSVTSSSDEQQAPHTLYKRRNKFTDWFKKKTDAAKNWFKKAGNDAKNWFKKAGSDIKNWVDKQS